LYTPKTKCHDIIPRLKMKIYLLKFWKNKNENEIEMYLRKN